jgi:hypothetical protein
MVYCQTSLLWLAEQGIEAFGQLGIFPVRPRLWEANAYR